MGRSKSLQAPWQSNAPADNTSREVGHISARCPLALACFTQVTHWRCWSRAQAVPRMVQGDSCSQDPRDSQLEEETQATPASFLRCQRAPATRRCSFVWVSLREPQSAIRIAPLLAGPFTTARHQVRGIATWSHQPSCSRNGQQDGTIRSWDKKS